MKIKVSFTWPMFSGEGRERIVRGPSVTYSGAGRNARTYAHARVSVEQLALARACAHTHTNTLLFV